jgi:hypothetical protein
MICSNSSTCIQCLDQYTISGGVCVPCVNQNCSQCQNSDTICQSCLSGLTGDYCNTSCSNYCSICYAGVCYLCQNTYYSSSTTGKCEPMTILCQVGNNFQSCSQCNSAISKMGTNGFCVPYYIIDDYNQLLYLTALNNP